MEDEFSPVYRPCRLQVVNTVSSQLFGFSFNRVAIDEMKQVRVMSRTTISAPDKGQGFPVWRKSGISVAITGQV